MKKNNLYILISIVIVLITLLALFYFSPKRAIIRNAKRFLDEEEEINNSGFKNAKFQSKMTGAGWYKSAQWCSFFAKLVFTEALFGKRKKLANELISGSSQLTWANFKNNKSGLFETSDEPKKGGLVIWQSLSDASKGHVGIVISHNKDYFKTIEGNSNNVVVNLRDLKKNIKKDTDKQIKTEKSEGKVAYHIRKYTGDGMKLLGFINIT